MSTKRETWRLDQFTKSQFFHQKLHEWALIEVAQQIEAIVGQDLEWKLDDLGISTKAWNKTIHSGIKPVVVFAHPDVLTTIEKSTSYYRMLAMVSQKSMNQVGLPIARYEKTSALPKYEAAQSIAHLLNSILSQLIDVEQNVNRREFDLWRGMAAGSQAQGSWQNAKGDRAEIAIRNDLLMRLRQSALIATDIPVDTSRRVIQLELLDGRELRMGSEPDVIIYSGQRIQAAVEIKGGIDGAGVLERVGAAIKSLSRVKDEDPTAITILLISGVSLSPQALTDIQSNKQMLNSWFTFEEILQDPERRTEFYELLGLSLFSYLSATGVGASLATNHRRANRRPGRQGPRCHQQRRIAEFLGA